MLSTAAALLIAAPAWGEAEVERHLASMGTELVISVAAEDRRRALRASETALRAIEAAELRLSTWTPDSELAQLNRLGEAGDGTLSALLGAELAAALDWARRTGGAFDPACGALVAAWGLRGAGRTPTTAELAAALARSGFESVSVEPTPAGGRRARIDGGVQLEEGGFGKGAGLDRALQALGATDSAPRSATIDLGGQIAWFGGAERALTLAHPDRRDRAVVAVDLPPATASAATSGNSEHGRTVDGVRVGHLLDPRTGGFAADRGSATVIVADRVPLPCLAADALSTACFVLGPADAMALVNELDGVELLFLERVGDELEVRASTGLEGRITRLPAEPDPPATREAAPSAPRGPSTLLPRSA